MITVGGDLAGIIAPGVIAFDGVQVVARHEPLDAALAGAEQRLRTGGHDLEERITAVRSMYRRVGIDPTKTRPSSEALLRRVRKGDPLPRINSLVDICNWCSVELQLPFGLYDAGRIEGDIELRLGRAAEEYPGIRKDVVHLTGRPTLADARGPFGNPTSDSARTMVTIETTRALFVIYAPHSTGPASLAAALNLTSSRVVEFAGGRETGRMPPL